MTQVHNGIKYYTELLGAMNVALGLNRDASGLERLSESIDISIDPFSRHEYAWLRRERRYVTGQVIAATVAQTNTFRVTNPLGSGILAVVEGFTVAFTVASRPRIGFGTFASGTGAFGTLVTNATIPSDARNQPTGSGFGFTTRLVFSQDIASAGPAGTAITLPATAANVATTYPEHFTLAPGSFFDIGQNIANVGIDVLMVTRERLALPGEITGL